MKSGAILVGLAVALMGTGSLADEHEAKSTDDQQELKRAKVADIVERGITPEKKVQQRRVDAVRPDAARRQGDPQLPADAYVERRFKYFKCPAELQFPTGTMFTDQSGLKFNTAIANPGGCVHDLSPDEDKGGYCMTCGYEANVFIRRSSGSNYKCWVNEEQEDEFTCEYVAPLPPAKTCIFEIRLPEMKAMPYTRHTSGDKDVHSSATIKIDAEIQRGTGPQADALFLVMSASHAEVTSDWTRFELPPYAIKLQSQHYVDASASDVAACLNSYGLERPLSIRPKGIVNRTDGGHEWRTFEPGRGQDNLIKIVECRFDTRYDDDMKRVGCRRVIFKQDVKVNLN